MVRYHLRPLLAAGLVHQEKSGREMLYRIDATVFGEFTMAVQKLMLLRR